ASVPYGYALRDAETGEVIFGEYTGEDTGRGMIGDIDPDNPGLETWAVALQTAKGEQIDTGTQGTNMNIKWSADLTTQIVNGAQGDPGLVADVFGDWREELLVRTEDSSAIRMYLSTEVTDHKLYTLMHDAQYRTGIAWQNVAYNQPAYPSFYFASDMNWAEVPVPEMWIPAGLSLLENMTAEYKESGELTVPLTKQLENSLKQAKHHMEKGSVKQSVKFIEKFMFHLNRKPNQDNISPKAKRNLSYQAEQLIEILDS